MFIALRIDGYSCSMSYAGFDLNFVAWECAWLCRLIAAV